MTDIAYEDEQSIIYQVSVGNLDNNVYFPVCKKTSNSIIIDAADNPELLLKLSKKLKSTTAVHTHGHWDHVRAIAQLRKAGAKVGIGTKDSSMLEEYDFCIEDGQELPFGNLILKAIHTPGHTPGSTCYSIPGSSVLFSGDTLFPGGPGATHFPGGDFKQIMDSLKNKVFALFADNTVVLPGHGKATTIGNERPHLDEWIQRGW